MQVQASVSAPPCSVLQAEASCSQDHAPTSALQGNIDSILFQLRHGWGSHTASSNSLQMPRGASLILLALCDSLPGYPVAGTSEPATTLSPRRHVAVQDRKEDHAVPEQRFRWPAACRQSTCPQISTLKRIEGTQTLGEGPLHGPQST